MRPQNDVIDCMNVHRDPNIRLRLDAIFGRINPHWQAVLDQTRPWTYLLEDQQTKAIESVKAIVRTEPSMRLTHDACTSHGVTSQDVLLEVEHRRFPQYGGQVTDGWIEKQLPHCMWFMYYQDATPFSKAFAYWMRADDLYRSYQQHKAAWTLEADQKAGPIRWVEAHNGNYGLTRNLAIPVPILLAAVPGVRTI